MGKHADFTKSVVSALNTTYTNRSDSVIHSLTDHELGIKVTIEHLNIEAEAKEIQEILDLLKPPYDFGASGEYSGPVAHNDNGGGEERENEFTPRNFFDGTYYPTSGIFYLASDAELNDNTVLSYAHIHDCHDNCIKKADGLSCTR